ncbi:MAG: hypothetical protein IE926_20195, partial [Micrococcales bacterium]|nr:hypothetical protein [Micrococcales bacterium]
MSYAQCLAEAANFHGLPAVITTEAENAALALYYRDDEKWIGAARGGP